ncbi:MAG: AtpZ/AtpI family protein [Myxococcales bacterium]|nr:AtpZ/AtpI family protein [Myxococcales bacterium]USN51730.1 MAG: AtpZ/AtpI family protein [Myxococcales bacterium]
MKKSDKLKEQLENWRKEQAKAYRIYLKTSAVGLEFGLAIVIGALIGYFADKHFNSSPYGLLIGVLVGLIAAIKRIWLFSKAYLEKNKKDDE